MARHICPMGSITAFFVASRLKRKMGRYDPAPTTGHLGPQIPNWGIRPSPKLSAQKSKNPDPDSYVMRGCRTDGSVRTDIPRSPGGAPHCSSTTLSDESHPGDVHRFVGNGI